MSDQNMYVDLLSTSMYVFNPLSLVKWLANTDVINTISQLMYHFNDS